MASTYDVGTRAWQPDTAEGWVASELVSKNIEGAKAKLVFKLENGDVRFTIPSLVYSFISETNTIVPIDQNHRSASRGTSEWLSSFPTPPHESDHT